MPIPQFMSDLLQLLLDLAVPGAMCTLVLAGVALRSEGGVNFESGGRFGRWILWTVILLTVPQLLSWFAGQGVSMPRAGGGVTSSWLAGMESSFQSFVTNVIVARLAPILAAFFVLKAALDGAQGHNPLGSIVASIFLLTVSSTIQLFQGWNSGTQFALTDMLVSLWNYLAGTIFPIAAGLAVVGAVLNYVRHRPVLPLVGSALAFLSVSALWRLVLGMVG